MGLTIHYSLRLAGALPAAEVLALARIAHRRAATFARNRGLTRVTMLRPVDPAAPWCFEYVKERRAGGDVHHAIAPLRGWIFEVLPGRDCEFLTFALCRYPATILVQGRRIRTHCSGWAYAGHCKTQYTSLHGETHFLRCHCAVVDLLSSWQRLGLDVTISDEGNYWPSCDKSALLAEVRHMNCAVAALAGTAKDAADESGGASVEAPIFHHAAFEHLEAEGATQHAPELANALRATVASAKPMLCQPKREKHDDGLI